MNNAILLIKTLLLSTSQRNILKHTTDKKKKRKIIGNTVGTVVLYTMLIAISGTVMQPHKIDQSKCIKCGACMEKCKFGAISKK